MSQLHVYAAYIPLAISQMYTISPTSLYQSSSLWPADLPLLHTYPIPRTMEQGRLTLESSSPLPLQLGVEGVTAPNGGDAVPVPEVVGKAHTKTYNTEW